jgi:DNA-binding NarL/FixJ family response regulator
MAGDSDRPALAARRRLGVESGVFPIDASSPAAAAWRYPLSTATGNGSSHHVRDHQGLLAGVTVRWERHRDRLSPRELEVFQLLARGMSNREIANHLIVGETTVKTHVAHILTKLGVRDRVQAVVLAYVTGVIVPQNA